jgi:hypothetical protein
LPDGLQDKGAASVQAKSHVEGSAVPRAQTFTETTRLDPDSATWAFTVYQVPALMLKVSL